MAAAPFFGSTLHSFVGWWRRDGELRRSTSRRRGQGSQDLQDQVRGHGKECTDEGRVRRRRRTGREGKMGMDVEPNHASILVAKQSDPRPRELTVDDAHATGARNATQPPQEKDTSRCVQHADERERPAQRGRTREDRRATVAEGKRRMLTLPFLAPGSEPCRTARTPVRNHAWIRVFQGQHGESSGVGRRYLVRLPAQSEEVHTRHEDGLPGAQEAAGSCRSHCILEDTFLSASR